MDGFKPSPTPLELVQQQARKPANTASIRLDHILDGGVNIRQDGSKSGTGGHYLRSPTVQVNRVTGDADAFGVTKGFVSIRDPSNGAWVPKQMETTFYPSAWSKRQTQLEIEGAFQNSSPMPGTSKWQGTSPSGLKIQDYYDKPVGTGATAWPVYQGKN